MHIDLDRIVYSRICVEVSMLDGSIHYEISLNKLCSLPIAGNQYKLLEREAGNYNTSLDGFIDSLNFILNDQRNYTR